MKTTLLIFVALLFGINAFGQQTKKDITITETEPTIAIQIAALEDIIERAGENHKESLKAKAMIATLRKEQVAQSLAKDQQNKMKANLSPAEYDAWKAKLATKNNNSIHKTEEKK